MAGYNSPSRGPSRLFYYTLLMALGWTLVVAISLAWNLYHHEEEIQRIVLNVARTNAKKDALYRKWNTMHGGVYVPLTRQTPASPHLSHLMERDIDTPAGRTLTLMNAPYMLNQVNELAGSQENLKGYIKSLTPMRPENQADSWEAAALRSFTGEDDERSKVFVSNGQKSMRYISPLTAEKGCLINRAMGQQIEEGDIVGGISVTVPMAPYFAVAHQHRKFVWAGHFLIWLAGLCGIGFTFARRRKSIAENEKLQAQLLQAQKMEAVGRLSGGVAHDFNNLLTTILGYSNLALKKLPEGDPVKDDILDIRTAGERAAVLTRQLLAFSRKQDLESKVVNLNSIVDSLGKMVGRLIGEDVTLELRTGSPTPNILADPGQIEQIIMNLVVNAKDALVSGGKITVETGSIYLDKGYAQSHSGVTPGHYVLLAVTDTGEGMDKDVQTKIFEPFFTTKEQGKGTGLGLSTVYGIVEQHNAHINVYSEVGIGTTFKIYFPAVAEAEELEVVKQKQVTARRGSETILVVDDEPSIRRLIVDTLQPLGYQLIGAASAEEALLVAGSIERKIDLLLTDVVLKGMDGVELANLFTRHHPSAKILFMSGYMETSFSERDDSATPADFLPKPLTPDTLVAKLKEVLG